MPTSSIEVEHATRRKLSSMLTNMLISSMHDRIVGDSEFAADARRARDVLLDRVKGTDFGPSSGQAVIAGSALMFMSLVRTVIENELPGEEVSDEAIVTAAMTGLTGTIVGFRDLNRAASTPAAENGNSPADAANASGDGVNGHVEQDGAGHGGVSAGVAAQPAG